MPFEIPKPEHPYNGKTFTFMGWEFADREVMTSDGKLTGYLLSWHILPNPEAPNLIYSYKGYWPEQPGSRTYAAAWLISHWFEHYMGVCPCLHGDGPSNFRTAFIETLLA